MRTRGKSRAVPLFNYPTTQPPNYLTILPMFGKIGPFLPNIGKIALGRGGWNGVSSGKAFLKRIPMTHPFRSPASKRQTRRNNHRGLFPWPLLFVLLLLGLSIVQTLVGGLANQIVLRKRFPAGTQDVRQVSLGGVMGARDRYCRAKMSRDAYDGYCRNFRVFKGGPLKMLQDELPNSCLEFGIDEFPDLDDAVGLWPEGKVMLNPLSFEGAGCMETPAWWDVDEKDFSPLNHACYGIGSSRDEIHCTMMIFKNGYMYIKDVAR